MSNINSLVLQIQSTIDIYELQAENQDKKKEICYEGNTLSYANWILGLHKDESPNTTNTVYLYTNVCKKNDGMYEEYLLVRPDKKIKDDKTLRTHMKEKYKKDEGDLKDNKDLLTDGRTELNRLTEKLKENETLRKDKVKTLKQIRKKVTTEQEELTDKKTTLEDEGLEDKLNEISPKLLEQQKKLREKQGEIREKEEQRDDIMNSLQNIQGGADSDDDNAGPTDISITATTLLDTNDDTEGMEQQTNDDTEGMEQQTNDDTEGMEQQTNDNTEGMEQQTNDDDQRIEQLNEKLEQLNEELEQLNKELEPLQQEVTVLEEDFSKINNRIQELGIATLEQTITDELESIQTLTQELTELNKQGGLIDNDIEVLDVVSTLEQKIEAHKHNFESKPNKLYEIKIKDFGDDNVQAVNVLNADYIDIGMLYEDVAYMVGKKPTELPTEDPVIISESDNTESTSFAQQPVVTGESISDSDSDTGSDNVSIGESDNTESTSFAQQPVVTGESISDSDSDTGSDNVSIGDLDILTPDKQQLLLDEFDSNNLTLQEQDKPVVISLDSDSDSDSDFNIEASFFNEKPLLEEVPSDNLTLQEPPAVISLNSNSDSDSDSESDVNIKTSDIVTHDEQGSFNDSLLELPDTDTILQQEQLELPKDIINETSNILTQDQLELSNEDEDEYDEEAFFHDATPKLIEDLQFIEDQLKSYDDYKYIKDRTFEVVESIIKENLLEHFKELYINASIGDLPATLIITKLSNALKKKDINKFLSMISDMKTSINEYYNTNDNNEQEILEQLVKKFRKYRGGSVKKQKTKKQKPLRKNNSFRKKRKAKV